MPRSMLGSNRTCSDESLQALERKTLEELCTILEAGSFQVLWNHCGLDRPDQRCCGSTIDQVLNHGCSDMKTTRPTMIRDTRTPLHVALKGTGAPSRSRSVAPPFSRPVSRVYIAMMSLRLPEAMPGQSQFHASHTDLPTGCPLSNVQSGCQEIMILLR